MKRIPLAAVFLAGCVVSACKPASDPPTRRELLEQQIEQTYEAQERYQRELPESLHESLHKELATRNSFAQEFRRVFPQAYQISGRMAHIGPLPPISAAGIIQDRLVFTVDLYQRYRLRCVIPFTLRDDFRTVEKWEEPYYSIQHIYSIEIREDGSTQRRSRWLEFPSGSFRFGYAEWQRLRDSDFDWHVIGVQLLKDKPVDGFQYYVDKSYRDRRI